MVLQIEAKKVKNHTHYPYMQGAVVDYFKMLDICKVFAVAVLQINVAEAYEPMRVLMGVTMHAHVHFIVVLPLIHSDMH